MRGATPRPRSGAEAGRTSCPKGGGQEELPHIRGQGQWPRVPGYDSAGKAESSYPSPRSGVVAGWSYPTSEVRGGCQEKLPCVRGQGWRPRGATEVRGQGPWLGGATPRPRSGAAAERRYPASEVWGRGQDELPRVRGWDGSQDELPRVRGQGRPGGATPRPHARGQGRRPGGATPRPRSGGGAIPR